MALYEFTQQFTYSNPGSTAQYSLLQPNPGVYIIKGMNCYSSSGLVVAGTGTSVQMINANSSTPSVTNYIYSTAETTSDNEILGIFSPLKQVILTLPYIGTIAHLTDDVGSFTLNLSYVYIPSSNANSANFNTHIATVTNTIGAPFTGVSATSATIIKSILVANIFASSTTITLFLNGVAFDTQVIAIGGSYVSPIPIYLSNTQTLTVGSTSASTVQVIYSYTLN